jgi:hypothetical protein
MARLHMLQKHDEFSDIDDGKILLADAVEGAVVRRDPFPYLVAKNMLRKDAMDALKKDFPEISKPGFFPLSTFKREGAFDELLTQMETELAPILTRKLGLELRDKPHMITIRKWSAAKDGRIHNDGEAKIATCLVYLNETWGKNEDGGRFRVLRDNKSFDSDTVEEVSPDYGNMVAFVRTENSWHGHKPFVGERRVIQITWLRSWEDYKRKEKRGKFSFLLKKLLPRSY